MTPAERNARSATVRAARAQQPIIDVLAATRRRDDGLSASYIARRTGRSLSAARRAIAHLIDAGVVERYRNDFDRRTIRYRLTKESR